MNSLVFLKPNSIKAIPLTTSKIISEFTGVAHRYVKKQIELHKTQIETFGLLVAYETESTGGRPEEITLLNEQQATLLVTFLKNTPVVVDFKTVSEFFIEQTYLDSTGRTLPCYYLTRKGCDMVANKMTGEKGVLFTATYVTKFEEMETDLKRKQIAPNFTPRMDLDVAKFVSKELKGNPTPSPMTLNILQEVFAQAGVNIPLDQYRKKAEEAKQVEAERIAANKKSGLQPGTIPRGRPNRVKELREARGWCQSYLAHKAGISRPMISYAERYGPKNTSQRTWEGICKAFEMPVEEVFPMQIMDKQ